MFQSGIPKTIDWWILQIVIVAIMAVLGEWICIQKEIKEIPVGSLGQQLRQQRYDSFIAIRSYHLFLVGEFIAKLYDCIF